MAEKEGHTKRRAPKSSSEDKGSKIPLPGLEMVLAGRALGPRSAAWRPLKDASADGGIHELVKVSAVLQSCRRSLTSVLLSLMTAHARKNTYV